MVLPPVAVGLLLLALLARQGPVGRLIAALGGDTLLLTWQAAAIASAVMSFPLLVMGARQAFDSVPRRLEQVAATLGASRWRIFRSITLPHATRGLLYGFLFAFARGLGEFGATALVAGDTPGETETLALAIYSRIHQFEDRDAALLTLISIAIALLTTGAAELFLRERRGRAP
jgi:molybdate transport system permease protein